MGSPSLFKFFKMHRSLALISLCLLGAALAQRPSWFDILAFKLNGLDDTIDQVHNYTHLMIAINDEWPNLECHFIEIDPQWEPLLQDPIKVQQISEEIYHLVHGGHVPETELTPEQLLAKY